MSTPIQRKAARWRKSPVRKISMTTKKTYYVLRDIDEEARKLLSEDDVLKAIMLAARKNNWI
mgnify:CR=1 FL=1